MRVEADNVRYRNDGEGALVPLVETALSANRSLGMAWVYKTTIGT